MKIVTADEMRRIEERAAAEFGLDAGTLMERAGAAVARFAVARFRPDRTCVIAGKGACGGDALVAARKLKEDGRSVDVVTMAAPEALAGATLKAWHDLTAAGVEPRAYSADGLADALTACDLVIDGLLGTGARGPAVGTYAEAIGAINRSGRPVVSIDVPSGLRETHARHESMRATDSPSGTAGGGPGGGPGAAAGSGSVSPGAPGSSGIASSVPGAASAYPGASSSVPGLAAATARGGAVAGMASVLPPRPRGLELPGGPVVRATATLTLGLPKISVMTMPGAALAGELTVEHLGMPAEVLEGRALALHWSPPADLAQWLPPRMPDANKGSFGRVGIVAGSARYAGAAILVARAALRSGAGLVYIFSTKEMNAIYKAALPEAVTEIVPSLTPDALTNASADAIVAFARKLDVLVVGPGLGTAGLQRGLVMRLVREVEKPMVIDADALTCLSPTRTPGHAPSPTDSFKNFLRDRPDCVLTPHPGEMARMLHGGNPLDDVAATSAAIQRDRLNLARDFAREHRLNLLLKGASTVFARSDGHAWIVPGACAALAKAGTGDVLAGAIAGLIAQGARPWRAAVVAAHAHLEAGRRCAARTGERGVLATEVADELPLALRSLEALSEPW